MSEEVEDEGKKNYSPEEQALRDKDCDRAGREHKFHWLWVGGVMTENAQCSKCGLIRPQRRQDENG